MDIRHPGQVFGLERRRGACGYATVSQVWWILSPCGRREGNEIAALFWKCFRCFDRLATVFVFVFRHPYMLWQFVHLKVSDTSLQDSPFCIYLCMCVCGRVLSWLNRVTNSCQWFGKKHISYGCHFEVRRNGLGINDAGYRWLHFGWCTLAAADRIRWGCAGALTLKKHRRNPCKNWPKCLFWIHYVYKYCKSTMNAFLSFYIKDHNMIRRYYTYYLWYTYIVYNYIMYRLSNLTKTYAYLSIHIYIYIYTRHISNLYLYTLRFGRLIQLLGPFTHKECHWKPLHCAYT